MGAKLDNIKVVFNSPEQVEVVMHNDSHGFILELGDKMTIKTGKATLFIKLVQGQTNDSGEVKSYLQNLLSRDIDIYGRAV